jgi:hypothetical protein
VSPLKFGDILVSNDGVFVVSVSWQPEGPYVVVIYERGGHIIRSMKFADFAQPGLRPVRFMDMWWGMGHYIDNECGQLVLKIYRPEVQHRLYEVRVDLLTGEIVSRSD